MNNVDIKTRKIIASLIHSRAIVVDAPMYVLTAMRRWVEELDRIEGKGGEILNGFSDTVSVSDSAILHLKNKEDNLN